MGSIGWQEILLIMVLALIVFGPKRLPEIGRQVGRALREVRKVSGEFQEEIRSGLAPDDENFPYMRPGGSAGGAGVSPGPPDPEERASTDEDEGAAETRPAPPDPLRPAPSPAAPEPPPAEPTP